MSFSASALQVLLLFMYFEISFHVISELFDGNLVIYIMPRCFVRSVRPLNDTFIHETGSFSPESKSIFVFDRNVFRHQKPMIRLKL